MTIFIFGNPNLPEDSLPLRILPKLRRRFPNINFCILDPHEEWDIPDELIILDTVVGIKDVEIFDNLNQFTRSPHVSLHDFDALTNLLYLQKLSKLKKIKIIGIPPNISSQRAISKVSTILNANRSSKNEKRNSCTDHRRG